MRFERRARAIVRTLDDSHESFASPNKDKFGSCANPCIRCVFDDVLDNLGKLPVFRITQYFYFHIYLRVGQTLKVNTTRVRSMFSQRRNVCIQTKISFLSKKVDIPVLLVALQARNHKNKRKGPRVLKKRCSSEEQFYCGQIL